ncbi:hypothetical protein BV22DRAFT_754130 [Leucogyrophana mollusca]|uniref:Uncharacterized protein n=1 Tax=Leucogyrophana mollusca TaxID=85980 RepID=A0ACB8B7B8_9AGAM|nr:hypothetical protein BV22DRAFT_754130 [Leucogyrophana mollusca]
MLDVHGRGRGLSVHAGMVSVLAPAIRNFDSPHSSVTLDSDTQNPDTVYDLRRACLQMCDRLCARAALANVLKPKLSIYVSRPEPSPWHGYLRVCRPQGLRHTTSLSGVSADAALSRHGLILPLRLAFIPSTLRIHVFVPSTAIRRRVISPTHILLFCAT